MGLKSNNIQQISKGWRVADRNLQKIYSLTMNLLQYSKAARAKLEPINPRVLIDDCVELIATAATEKGVMVVADIDPHHPAIPLDPDGMHPGADELLSNALDAVEPKQGLIRVICPYDNEAKASVLEVVDNGVGHPAAG